MKISGINTYNPNYTNISIKKDSSIYRNDNILGNNIHYGSLVSFGWCEKHQVRSNEVSQIFLNQLEKQREEEREKEYEKTRAEYLNIADKSNKEAVNFLMQFTNRQKNEAEFIPLWSLMNNEKLNSEMQKSKTFSDPISALISLNLVQDIKVKNETITNEQLKKAQGSLQLHTAVILIHQIEKNMNNPASLAYQDKDKISELLGIAKNHLENVYGKNIYEKVLKLSEIGTKPDFASKKSSLDILVKIDNEAQPLDFGQDFSKKLETLVTKQRQMEYEKLEIEQLYKREVTIGEKLSESQKTQLNSILQNSSDINQRKAAAFMLKFNSEIRFSKECLTSENLHHREHLLGLSNHTHDEYKHDIELDDVEIKYHEHTHNGHTHVH